MNQKLKLEVKVTLSDIFSRPDIYSTLKEDKNLVMYFLNPVKEYAAFSNGNKVVFLEVDRNTRKVRFALLKNRKVQKKLIETLYKNNPERFINIVMTYSPNFSTVKSIMNSGIVGNDILVKAFSDLEYSDKLYNLDYEFVLSQS